jgi:hypothetical protein
MGMARMVFEVQPVATLGMAESWTSVVGMREVCACRQKQTAATKTLSAGL